MRALTLLALAAASLLAAACAYNGGALAGDPDGTADTTHGANGIQTTPH